MSRKRRTSEIVLTVLIWLAVWQIAAMWIDNKIFLPSLFDTAKSLKGLLFSTEFYQSIGTSLGNIAGGFLLGIFSGTVLAVAAAAVPFLETFLSLPIRVIKATPVASFTILALFWMKSTELSILVSFFMVLPVIYTNVLTGIRETDQEMLEMARVFRIRWYNRVRFFYVPAVVPYLLSAASVAIGLAWKSGIAAEVIGLARNSIGNQLYQAKIYMEMPDLFAWTVVIVVISVASEKLVLLLIAWLERATLGKAEETVADGVVLEKVPECRTEMLSEEEIGTKELSEQRRIVLNDIRKAYGERKVLEDISLTLSPGQPIALMGSSGIGKTTLLRIVLGVEKPDGGTVVREKDAREFSVVFQENRLLENVSVERNLQLVCKQKEQREEIPQLLRCLGLAECREQRVACLSGGMKRRVAIGRALLSDAPVLLLDEPFQGLDADTRQAVLLLVKRKAKGKSVLLITHEENEAIGLGCSVFRI